jgi:hypothetical protein
MNPPRTESLGKPLFSAIAANYKPITSNITPLITRGR